jgi:hypothetical protein
VVYASVAAEEYAEGEVLSHAEILKLFSRMDDHSPKLGQQDTQRLQGNSQT